MEYSLADLVDLARVKAAMEMFYDITGIPGSVLDTEGNVLIGIGWQRICTDFHRVHPETCMRCIQSDTELAAKLNLKKGYASYNCLNGLVDFAVPIVIEEAHLGNLFTGQFLFSPPDREFFRRQAVQYGFDVADYLEALDEVPVFEREKVEQGMQFLLQMAEILGEMGLAKKKLAVVNEELEYEVKERTDQLREEIQARKKAEVEKLEAFKLEGVLEMAGAASHEFSQPLQALQNDARFLKDTVRSGDIDVIEALESVIENVQRLAEQVGKVQRITRYEAAAYSNNVKIVDIDKSSD